MMHFSYKICFQIISEKRLSVIGNTLADTIRRYCKIKLNDKFNVGHPETLARSVIMLIL